MPSNPHPDRHSVKAAGFGAQLWEAEAHRPADFQRLPYVEHIRGGGKPDTPAGALGTVDSGAVEHVLREGAGRVTRINETTRAQLRKLIQEGLEEGLSPAELGDRIQASTLFSEYRAERIARTELMFAYNQSSLSAYGKYGVQQVEASDGDQDDECSARHGKVFSTLEAMSIEDHPNGTLNWIPIASDLVSQANAGGAPKPAPRPKPTPPSKTLPKAPEMPKPVEPVKPKPRWHADNATSQQAEDAVYSGHATLEEVMEQRHGVRVIREAGYNASPRHDAMVVRAWERATAANGGRINVEVFRYAGFDNPGAAAEYFYPGQVTPGNPRAVLREIGGYFKEVAEHTEVRMYKTTEPYIGRAQYQRYHGVDDFAHGVDDFLSVVEHELGHAAEFGRQVTGSLADLAAGAYNTPYASAQFEEYGLIWKAGSEGPEVVAKSIAKQLAQVRKSLRESVSTIDELQPLADAGAFPADSFLARRLELHKMLREAYQRQELHLLELREQFKTFKNARLEPPLTEYGRTNAREDFAESFWYYLNKPDILRERCPMRWSFFKRYFP